MRLQTRQSRTLPAKTFSAVLAGLLFAGYSIGSAHADSYAYGAGYFGEYSDNIRRAPAAPLSEWINSIIAGAAYIKDGPVVNAHLLAQAEYRNYKNNAYRDSADYYADSSLVWHIVRKRLQWYFADRYSQAIQDVTLPATPDNLVNTNVMSTGPDFFIHFGAVNSLELGLRVGSAHYSEGNLDNQRYGASARWKHASSANTNHSLNFETETIRYDDDVLNENLRKQDAFFRLDSRQGYSVFQADLGTSRLTRARTGETSGALVRMKSIRQLTSISSIGLTLAGEYLEAGNILLATNSSAGSASVGSSAPGTAGGITNDYFYTKRIDGNYHRNDDSNGLDATAYIRDIDYDFSLQDRRESGGRIEATHILNNLLIVAAYGSHIRVKYLNDPREDRENEAGIRFLYRIDKRYTTTLEGRRTWRYSTDAFQEYTDNRVLVSLFYSSGPLFSPRKELTGGSAPSSFQVQETFPRVTPSGSTDTWK